jgi:hypothetical protein
MTVYVDDMYLYPMGQFKRGPRTYKMSHMVSDAGDEELHVMAAKIGVARKWFQCKRGLVDDPDNHYDIAMSTRIKAVLEGAVEVTMRELSFGVRARRMAIAQRLREEVSVATGCIEPECLL